MAQLWGGRFTKATDQLVYNFNASITFDQKFYKQDIEGSIAHVKMLGKQGILTEQEMNDIITTLQEIKEDVESGKLEITSEYEDIHSFVEANLIDRLGDTGKKLHTGRSRNDQVALDMRLYTRDEVLAVDGLLKELLTTILHIMEENTETIMPGFTHLQKAQPITLAHHMGAYFEMFKRDRLRLHDIYERMNYCPLGSGALAGTTYPLDREYTAELLGFYGPTLNSMDGVSDRDYLIEFLSACATIMMHLSRFSEEVIIWNSNEYQFVEIDDAYSTGSSIMPQKKNPDIAELVRGKTGRVYGALMSLLTTMKGIPLAYNKDMQEDKELTFDAIDTVKGCIALFTGIPYLMMCAKVQKVGSVLLMGLITGLIYYVTGQFTVVILVSFVLACGLAEITRVITHYRSMAGNLVSFVLFSVGMVGSPLPIWLMREDFLRQITEQGMPADYVNTLAALSSNGMLIVLFLAPVVGAIIGGILARAMFRKHFEKAGLV